MHASDITPRPESSYRELCKFCSDRYAVYTHRKATDRQARFRQHQQPVSSSSPSLFPSKGLVSSAVLSVSFSRLLVNILIAQGTQFAGALPLSVSIKIWYCWSLVTGAGYRCCLIKQQAKHLILSSSGRVRYCFWLLRWWTPLIAPLSTCHSQV